MNLTEIEKGTDVFITAKIQNKQVSFSSIAVGFLEEDLLIKAITNDKGIPISLASDNVSFEVAIIGTRGNPIMWENVVIKFIKYNGVAYHKITQKQEGKEVNRRRNFRLPINERCEFTIGFDRNTCKGILKNISVVGFGFLSDKEIPLLSTVHIICQTENNTLDLYGKTIREEKVPNNKGYIYGCSLVKTNINLDKYIAQKQRENLNRQRNS